MTSSVTDVRPLTLAEIDGVFGAQIVHYPPPNGTQIVVTTYPGHFQVTTPKSTIIATSSSVSQVGFTGSGGGFSSIST
jgi:hypothetical protein